MQTGLANHIERTVSGPMWHGPALGELLAEVSASTAARRAIADGHTIWELVLHVSAWAEIVRARLAGERLDDPSDDENWPPVRDLSDAAWRAACERLAESHRALAADVRLLGDDALSRRVRGGGAEYSVRTMLLGVIEHGTYHGGQIALLKKLA